MENRSDRTPRLCFRRLRRPRLNRSERQRIEDLARQLAPECRLAGERAFFEPFAPRGLGDDGFAIIGDLREIPLLTEGGSEMLEYRLSTLAQPGDVVPIGTKRSAEFERYREEVFQCGEVDYFDIGRPDAESRLPTPVTCLKDAATYAALLQRVRRHECTTVLAHITTGTVWALARKLGQDTGWPMRVAGPLPTLCRLANNKLWFASVVRQLLGQEAAPVEHPVHSAAALTSKVRALAHHSNKVVVKVPDSAGSAGNFVIPCADIRRMDVPETHRYLSDILSGVDGRSHFPMLAQIWENQVLTSPSLQLWIPDPKDGQPIVEGVYEQALSGQHGEFAGAAPADLPRDWDARVVHEGVMIASVFQALGYYGRCSFDAIISGIDFRAAKLLWIECNGRWGGVSVPMTLLNSLFPDTEIPACVIFHAPAPGLRRQAFSDGIARLKDILWSPGRREGVIFLTPSGFETGEQLHFVSLAASTELARRQAALTVNRLSEGY